MALDATTQFYIDAQSRDSAKELIRKKHVKYYRKARPHRDALAAERLATISTLTTRGQDYEQMIAEEVLKLKAAEREVRDKKKLLAYLRSERTKRAEPITLESSEDRPLLGGLGSFPQDAENVAQRPRPTD